MKKILVTGSNGLLGQTLTELITSTQRAQLIATSKGPNRYPATNGYSYSDLDIANPNQLEDAVTTFKPDVIINTAAITNVDICHQDKGLCWKINVESVRHLAEICEQRNIHLIHLSTDFVFDGKNGPYSEDALPNPVSIYGQSKYEAEKVIQNSTCKWAILRTILVYGVTANLSRSNIVLWAKSALEKGEQIRVVTDQWRMPTLVLDLAEACLRVAETGAEGLFHVSGKDMLTVYELVQRVAEFWELDRSLISPISSDELNQEAKRPIKTGFKLDKAMGALGYKPHSFSEGLRIVDNQLAAKN